MDLDFFVLEINITFLFGDKYHLFVSLNGANKAVYFG